MSQFDDAFRSVGELVARFRSNEAHYTTGGYDEIEARKDFIDKFFIALGWDVNHDSQTNPYAQEVKVERSPGGTQRRADYAFYLAPNYRDVRFYVEAKKPHGDIATADNCFQTVRYGSGSRTPLAVLTSFEQFHVLDSRFKADIKHALKRCISSYHYQDYLDRESFGKIYWLFSHEAVSGGAIERFAADLPKRGEGIPPPHLRSIDDAFLDDLEGYRALLARAFKKRNPRLESEPLTEATQRVLDRLVFMRFLEDKLIEPEKMVARLGASESAWRDFGAMTRRLNSVYNGIVFRQHVVLDAPNFRADNEVFAQICQSLSNEHSPYDFDAIAIHILGSIYERFLGKVIVATDKRVRVEDKPEVRKAGGVYYTPEYIVRYIVENTVGKLIAGKTPDEIAEMRFADISCGSGSFVLGMYDLLLEYHGRYYNENPGKARVDDCIRRDGKLYLSLQKKRKILLNNVYGVDIDYQAVEVCQLSLYLRLLKDETAASARQYQFFFAHDARMKKLLPDLSRNIVCGNSLISADILNGHLFAGEEERKLNPMNFEDAFPEVMRRGGFDAVIGNPPYLYSAGQEHKAYFDLRFKLSQYQTDFYVFFIERAIQLLRHLGHMGLIVSDSWIKGKYFAKLRENLLRQRRLESVTVFDYPPFHGAAIENSIILLQKAEPNETFVVRKFTSPSELNDINILSVEASLGRGFIDIHQSDINSQLIAKVERNSSPLSAFCKINRGVHAYRTDGYGRSKYSIGPQTKRDKDEHSYHSSKKLDPTFFPEVKGRHLARYSHVFEGTYISYGDWLAEARTPEFFFNPKLAIRKIIAPKLVCTFIRDSAILDQSVYVVIRGTKEPPDLLFFLGILASSVGGWYLQNKYGIYDTLYPWFTKEQLAQFPIPEIDLRKELGLSRHNDLVAKVDALLAAKKEFAKAKTDKDRKYYENRCAALDGAIDRLVYELYGLTEDEIRIVESDANK